MSARTIAAIAAFLSLASLAKAQTSVPCNIVIDSYGRLNVVRLPAGGYTSYIGGGVTAHCGRENNRLVADSAEHYETRGVLYLIGNVRYSEPRATVTSSRMTYFQGEERLTAEGNVLTTLANGTTMRGPVADYFRVTIARPKERLIATGRPQMTLVERDSSGRAAVPVVVNANRIQMDGDSLMYASGRVEITRTDITSRSDSAFMDAAREVVRLLGAPIVTGRGERPFTLEGGEIDLYSRNRRLERVIATPEAHATSEDLDLLADSIDLRIRGDQLERAFAWGPSRATARSPERDIVADSLDIQLTDQRLREVRAVGSARATAIPDPAHIVTNERDWLEGDTVVAWFDTSTAAGARGRTQARELVATGEARSYHQLPAQGAGAQPDRPNLNYVRGDTIVVELSTGEVRSVTVSGNASGVYLERAEAARGLTPPPPGTPPPPPSPPPPPPRE